MLIGLSEGRLAWWAAAAAGVSFMLPLFGLLLMFGAVSAAAGDYRNASAKGFWMGTALVVGYAVSIYLLTSLAGKARRRRLGSLGILCRIPRPDAYFRCDGLRPATGGCDLHGARGHCRGAFHCRTDRIGWRTAQRREGD